MNETITTIARDLGQALLAKKAFLSTAESCTGGWVAQAITAIPGSSMWFERGFITYSNLAKHEMLRVAEETLQKYGAVSEETAIEMAEGALAHSHADVSLSVTGIAGPDGGTSEKPVGYIWFAIAGNNKATQAFQKTFGGDRQAIREQAVEMILHALLDTLAAK